MDDNRRLFRRFAEDMCRNACAVFMPQYRVWRLHSAEPGDGLKDVRAALSCLPVLFEDLGLRTERIILGGGSAGAQLALCAAGITGEEPVIKPERMFFFNPVCRPESLAPWLMEECGQRFDFSGQSPLVDMKTAATPMLILHGTDDEIAPCADSAAFAGKYRSLGGECRLELYPGRKHGFHHPDRGEADYASTLEKILAFLEERKDK